MNYKHSCVIDTQGNYITFVLVLFETDRNGEPTENIQCYTLKDGQDLLDTAPPTGFVKPRWNKKEWTESATPKEIEDAKKNNPILPITKTELEILKETVDMLVLEQLTINAGGMNNV